MFQNLLHKNRKSSIIRIDYMEVFATWSFASKYENKTHHKGYDATYYIRFNVFYGTNKDELNCHILLKVKLKL